MKNDLPEFLSPATVARLLEVHRRSVYRWIDKKVLPAIRIEGTVRIDRKAFAAFLDEKRKETA